MIDPIPVEQPSEDETTAAAPIRSTVSFALYAAVVGLLLLASAAVL